MYYGRKYNSQIKTIVPCVMVVIISQINTILPCVMVGSISQINTIVLCENIKKKDDMIISI